MSVRITRIKVTRLQQELAEKDTKIMRLETERARLANENEILNATPASIVEWKRQEVVATTAAVLDILGELSTKVGIVYGNVAAIQGVFVNRGALNMSARTRREIALGGNSSGEIDQAA
jgi:hypothetical protein